MFSAAQAGAGSFSTGQVGFGLFSTGRPGAGGNVGAGWDGGGPRVGGLESGKGPGRSVPRAYLIALDHGEVQVRVGMGLVPDWLARKPKVALAFAARFAL
ncbi:hypothetical protein HerbRD11066_76610 [Herbidospora sp. RD11066]